MNIISKIMGVLGAISIFLLIIYGSISLTAFNPNFYTHEYDKNGTYAQTKTSQKELTKVTNNLIGYINDTIPTLDMKATVNGQLKEFFNDKEKSHMQDVKHLLNTVKTAKNCAIIILIISLIILIIGKKRAIYNYFKYSGFTMILLLILSAIATYIYSTNFQLYFAKMHELLFSNSNWLLDPTTSLLINMVPIDFFVDLGKTFAFYTISFSVIYIVVSFLILKFTKKTN